MRRRDFLATAGLGTLAAVGGRDLLSGTAPPGPSDGRDPRGPAAGSGGVPPGQGPSRIRPTRLRPGDTVGLVNPSSAVWREDDLRLAEERLRALELEPVRGEHVLARHGSFAGTDEERAADLNRMFRDDAVGAVLCGRGGWGAARILPLVDFDAVRASPKLFVGYSDVTALLLALHARTGLVTFHGPMGTSTFTSSALGWVRSLLFDAEALVYRNPPDADADALVRMDHRVITLRSGRARGRLLGGNLSVLSAIVGSGYLPDFRGSLLFLEDVGEAPYRVDRMMTQLALAGILDDAAGVIFGKCTGCEPGRGYGSRTLDDVLEHHLADRGVPAWSGAMIGHIDDQWTVPVGADAEMDADEGTLTLLEPAVR